MDPFLEHPGIWPDVHARLISEIARLLGPLLEPRFYIRLDERIYLDPDGLVFIGRPDLAVRGESGATITPPVAGRPVPAATAVEVPLPEERRETFLEIHAAGSGEVVTVLEILSPANKRVGRGRRIYERKRLQVLGSQTSLVEVDLLRFGEPMAVHGAAQTGSYRILVSHGDHRPRAELFQFSVRQPIPVFLLPLPGEAGQPEVSVRAALDQAYALGGYERHFSYETDPMPPLSAPDAAWADALLRAAGRR